MILPEAPELPYVLNGSSAAAGRAAQLREKIPFNCLAIAAFFAAVAGLFQLDIRSIQKAGAHGQTEQEFKTRRLRAGYLIASIFVVIIGYQLMQAPSEERTVTLVATLIMAGIGGVVFYSTTRGTKAEFEDRKARKLKYALAVIVIVNLLRYVIEYWVR